MDFYIRIRFKTSDKRPLEIKEEEIEIPHIGNDRLFLRTKESGSSILKSSELVLEGKTYESNEEALKFGEKYKDSLSFTFAYLGVPADFGDRTPKYTTSDLWLKIIAESSGYNTIPDILGLSVQPSETNLEISVPFPTVKNSINKDRFFSNSAQK